MIVVTNQQLQFSVSDALNYEMLVSAPDRSIHRSIPLKNPTIFDRDAQCVCYSDSRSFDYRIFAVAHEGNACFPEFLGNPIILRFVKSMEELSKEVLKRRAAMYNIDLREEEKVSYDEKLENCFLQMSSSPLVCGHDMVELFFDIAEAAKEAIDRCIAERAVERRRVSGIASSISSAAASFIQSQEEGAAGGSRVDDLDLLMEIIEEKGDQK